MANLNLSLALSLATGVLLTCANNAQAFSFVTNDFDQNPLSTSDAKNDIFLNSVGILDSNGNVSETVTDFSYITSAQIVYNDAYTGGNSGAASADIGDNATTGIKVEDASASDIAYNLGTNNLNNIIDTEDSGSFTINLSFDYALDNLLVWERGMNSDLQIQALDANGNLIGNALLITNDMWDSAGYSIDTQEIGGAQNVGSYGVNLVEDLGVDGPISSLQFYSEAGFNGPDWKFVGTNATRNTEAAKVPEPGLILGLGILGSVFLWKRPKRFSQN